MHVSAKGDYAVRAMVGLAAVHPGKLTASALAERFEMPRKFLESALADLKRAALVTSVRGAEGGYTLRRDPATITIGEVLRAIDGPLSDVHGLRPDEVRYPTGLEHMSEVWVAARSAVRGVFDEVTVDQLVTGDFPPDVRRLYEGDDAWRPRTGRQTPRLPRGDAPEWVI